MIEGNGATLLCGEASLAFYFEGGRDITLRGITFDTILPERGNPHGTDRGNLQG